MTEDPNFVRITLRIPKDLHENLVKSTGKKHSMNAEIIHRLELSFEEFLSVEGMVNVSKRLEATAEVMDRLFAEVKNTVGVENLNKLLEKK